MGVHVFFKSVITPLAPGPHIEQKLFFKATNTESIDGLNLMDLSYLQLERGYFLKESSFPLTTSTVGHIVIGLCGMIISLR